MQIHDFAGMTGEEREALSRVLSAQESLEDVFGLGYGMAAPEPDEHWATDSMS